MSLIFLRYTRGGGFCNLWFQLGCYPWHLKLISILNASGDVCLTLSVREVANFNIGLQQHFSCGEFLRKFPLLNFIVFRTRGKSCLPLGYILSLFRIFIFLSQSLIHLSTRRFYMISLSNLRNKIKVPDHHAEVGSLFYSALKQSGICKQKYTNGCKPFCQIDKKQGRPL